MRTIAGWLLFFITFLSLSSYLALTLPEALARRNAQALSRPTVQSTVVAAQKTMPTAIRATSTPTKGVVLTQAQTTKAAPLARNNFPYLFNTPVPGASGQILVDSAQRLVTLTQLGIGWLNDEAWSNDGTQLALATSTGIYVFNTQTHEMLFYIDTAGTVSCITFAPDDQILATGDRDGLVRIWEKETGRELASLGGHLLPVRRVAFSPDGRFLASASDDKTARLWDMSGYKQLAALEGHVQGVTGVAFTPDSKSLVTASMDFNLKIWSSADGTLLNTYVGPAPITDVAYTPDGKSIITGDGSSAISRWDATTGKIVDKIGNLSMPVSEVEVAPNGEIVAAAGTSGQVTLFDMKNNKIWSVKNEGLPRVQSNTNTYFNRIAFSPDSLLLASAIWDNTVRFYKTTDGSEAGSIRTFSDFINGMEVSPNSTYLAAQTIGNQIKIWNLPKAKLLYTYSGVLLPGRIFSYDSQYLAVKSEFGHHQVIFSNNRPRSFQFRQP